MTSLAQRVRDLRYSKGWGPDELANRAEISRTALYQIESGKTGLPRAGTLRRIAVALDVPMDELLAEGPAVATAGVRTAAVQMANSARAEELENWIAAEGASLTASAGGYYNAAGNSAAFLDELRGDMGRLDPDLSRRTTTRGYDPLLMREGELMSKLHDLLHSRMGNGVARILDDLHVMIQRNRNGS
ncbi:helix-turn-helix domain-containing protein [Aquisphaera insulae]|uniref:helix-turn-helix domain-containing protein n=1 Tax=Aquisphaera insulae TaxID=2712864 RepID=UPI0013ECD343|nr:helix-turn-helix transcriptional regulator [Aquisphaera insulae]